jgi:hypothetical protein
MAVIAFAIKDTNNMKLNTRIAIALAIIIAVLTVAVYLIKDRRISAGYKANLAAALKSSPGPARDAYVHDARTALRTTRDGKLQTELEQYNTDINPASNTTCHLLKRSADKEGDMINIFTTDIKNDTRFQTAPLTVTGMKAALPGMIAEHKIRFEQFLTCDHAQSVVDRYLLYDLMSAAGMK